MKRSLDPRPITHTPLASQSDYANRYRDPCAPERKLWRTVLTDAMRVAQGKNKQGRKYKGKCKSGRESLDDMATIMQIREAQLWLRSDRTDPGSFLWVCQVLYIRPQDIRESVGIE